MTQVVDVLVSVSSGGLKQDLSSAYRSIFSLSSKTLVPNNIWTSRVVKVEKVTTSGNEVLTVDHVYDIKGYQLLDNSFVKTEAVINSALKSTEFSLPNTQENLANVPVIGNKLRITFYYTVSNDSENISFSKSGTLYTNKKFNFEHI
jgi:hypothetical protein